MKRQFKIQFMVKLLNCWKVIKFWCILFFALVYLIKSCRVYSIIIGNIFSYLLSTSYFLYLRKPIGFRGTNNGSSKENNLLLSEINWITRLFTRYHSCDITWRTRIKSRENFTYNQLLLCIFSGAYWESIRKH